MLVIEVACSHVLGAKFVTHGYGMMDLRFLAEGYLQPKRANPQDISILKIDNFERTRGKQ